MGVHTRWKQLGGGKGKRGRRAGRKLQKTKVPLDTGIYNISGTDLSEDELKVLDKGFKFAPVKNFNKFQTYISLQKFIRTLNIKRYFLSKAGKRSGHTGVTAPIGGHSDLANKSVFNPPKNDHRHIEVFKNMVTSDLHEMKIKKIGDPSYLKKGISTLEKNKDVLIHPADKGGEVVVMSKSYYKLEIWKRSDFYQIEIHINYWVVIQCLN